MGGGASSQAAFKYTRRWTFLDEDGIHVVELLHDLMTGSKVVSVGGKQVDSTSFQIIDTGSTHKFSINRHQIVLTVALDGLDWRYTMMINGENVDEYNKRVAKKTKKWSFVLDNVPHTVYLLHDRDITIVLNGLPMPVISEFVENGSCHTFSIGEHVCSLTVMRVNPSSSIAGAFSSASSALVRTVADSPALPRASSSSSAPLPPPPAYTPSNSISISADLPNPSPFGDHAFPPTVSNMSPSHSAADFAFPVPPSIPPPLFPSAGLSASSSAPLAAPPAPAPASDARFSSVAAAADAAAAPAPSRAASLHLSSHPFAPIEQYLYEFIVDSKLIPSDEYFRNCGTLLFT